MPGGLDWTQPFLYEAMLDRPYDDPSRPNPELKARLQRLLEGLASSTGGQERRYEPHLPPPRLIPNSH